MDSADQRIVTLASLQPRTSGSEFVADASESVSPEDELNIARYEQVMDRLQEATDAAGSDVVVTARDREASLVQSVTAELATEFRALESGGQEVQFGTGIAGGDLHGWARVIFEKVGHFQDVHPILRPTTAEAETVRGDIRLAMTADWATGLYGAPVIAKTMSRMGAQRPFDLLMHLGDVYYSGTPTEAQDRFVNMWPFGAGLRNRALNGNHDMYAGGYGYFDTILRSCGQDASYFALQNEHWLLAGLDTAYLEHAIDSTQVAWLKLVIEKAGPGRKIVLFSHHQPFSRLSGQGPHLQDALRDLLEARRITAWYWGHEHQCVIYDEHERWGMHGRCLGNGGIPEPRPAEVTGAERAPEHPGVGDVVWRRLSATPDAPGSIVLDGPNRDMVKPSHQRRFGPHGFMTLTFDGPALVERVHLSDGTELLRKRIV